MLWSYSLYLFICQFFFVLILALILVLVDYALERKTSGNPMQISSVLILVLVDYALEQDLTKMKQLKKICFNPCFSGLCFGAIMQMPTKTFQELVLILVLVDYALEHPTDD